MSRSISAFSSVGVGRIGKLHAEHLAGHVPGAELAAVSDIDMTRAQAVATQFNVPVAVSDYSTLLADSEIDAVVICTPTDLHVQITQEAATAGKHVFCEKAPTFTASEMEEVIAVEQTSNGGKPPIRFCCERSQRRYPPHQASSTGSTQRRVLPQNLQPS